MYVYRSQLEMRKYKQVVSDIDDMGPNAPVALQAVKLLARYKAPPHDSEIVLMTLNEWMADPVSASNPHLQVIAASIYAEEDKLKEALKCLQHANTVEVLALSTQLYIKRNRLDLAAKSVSLMQNMDDDSTMTQLASAWLHMAKGGEHTRRRHTSSRSPRCCPTCPCSIVSLWLACTWESREAEAHLEEAKAVHPKCGETLIK